MDLPEISMQMMFGGTLVVVLLSLLLGLMIGRRTSSASQKYREVERKLDQVLQEKKLYEDEVVEHFSETANLINNLTESYRSVHSHLTKGATDLCQGEGPVSLDRLEGRDPAEIPPHLAQIQPPLDYAPKSSPDEKGMLNEEFGLERKPNEPAVEEIVSEAQKPAP